MERSLRWREWPVRRPPVSALKREEGGGTAGCEVVVFRFLGELLYSARQVVSGKMLWEKERMIANYGPAILHARGP
jgi:hypothetical protein